MRSMGEGHPPVVAISRSCPVETLRQYNLTQRRRERRGAKKRLARSVIAQSYLGDDAIVTGIPAAYNNLVHCQRNSVIRNWPCADRRRAIIKDYF